MDRKILNTFDFRYLTQVNLLIKLEIYVCTFKTKHHNIK